MCYVIHVKARPRCSVRTFIWGLRVQVPRQVTQCCSVLLLRGEKECVCVCVCAHDFKRWKGAWSECFAWTCEEFLFRNTKFSQSIQSVRAGHTDAEKPPTCPPSISFYIPRHSRYLCVSLQSVHPPCLISSPALSLSALPSFHSGFLFVLSSESPCQLRLKVETPSKLYSCLFWAAFK